MTYRDKLEPEANGVFRNEAVEHTALLSAAISLKRIADTLEKHQPIDWNTTGVQG